MNLVGLVGMSSGIDTRQLIADIVEAERAPRIGRIDSRRQTLEARGSALGEVRGAVSALAAALGNLAGSGALQPIPSSTDAAVRLSINARNAGPVSHAIAVDALASRQTLASDTFAERDAPLGGATLTFAFGRVTTDADGNFAAIDAAGAKGPATVVIDEADATPEGIVRKINAANIGVTASLVADGGGVRVVLSGSDGAASGFSIGVDPHTGGSAIEGLRFDGSESGMERTAAAADARIVIDGVAVARAGNRIDNLVAGHVLEISAVTTGAPVQLRSAYSAEELTAAAANFVAAYNEVAALLDDAIRPGTASAAAGPLAGDAATRALRAELRSVTTAVLGSAGGTASLADLGIRTDRSGLLSIDRARLGNAVEARPAEVAALFLGSTSTSSTALAVIGSPATVDGRFQLTDIVAATAGRLVGTDVSGAFDSPVVIGPENDRFDAAIDGRASLAIAIPHGSYESGEALAAAIAGALADDPVLAGSGHSASIKWTGSGFELFSAAKGSASSVALTFANAELGGRIGLAAATRTDGTNASARLDGNVLVGAGDTITGPHGSAIAGLKLRIFRDSAEADVDVRAGLAVRLQRIADAAVADSGRMGTADAAIERELQGLAGDEQLVDARAEALEAQLTRRFAVMEAALSQYRATQSFLEQQIDIWTGAGA